MSQDPKPQKNLPEEVFIEQWHEFVQIMLPLLGTCRHWFAGVNCYDQKEPKESQSNKGQTNTNNDLDSQSEALIAFIPREEGWFKRIEVHWSMLNNGHRSIVTCEMGLQSSEKHSEIETLFRTHIRIENPLVIHSYSEKNR